MTGNQDVPTASVSFGRAGLASDDALADLVAIEDDLRHARRRFWRRLLLVGCLLLLAVAVTAPRIASLPGPRRYILAAVNGRIEPMRIDVADWRLRWIGQQTFTGLAGVDPPTGMDIDITRIELEAGLLRLIPMGHVRLGTLTLTEPKVRIAPPPQRPAATVGIPPRTDDARRAPAVVIPAPGSAPRRLALPFHDLAVDLRIADGTVVYVPAGGDPITLEALRARLSLSSMRAPCPMEAAWNWSDGGGHVAVSGTLDHPQTALDTPARAAGRMNLTLADMQVARWASLIAPHLDGIRPTSGALDASLVITADSQANCTLEYTASLKDLQAALPNEATPTMPPAAIRLALQGTLRQGRFTLSEAALASPWATATADASLLLQPEPGTHPDDEARLSLRVNLVPLMRDWGRLLKLNPELEVADGRLLADLTLGHDAGGGWAELSAGTTNLLVRVDRSSLSFSPPPTLLLRARPSAESGWRIEQGEFQAPFAHLAGSGSAAGASLTGHIDLTRLARDLQVIAPQLPRMVGRIDLTAASRTVDDRTLANGTVTFTDVAIDGGSARPWVIETGTLTASAGLLPAGQGRWPRDYEDIHMQFTGSPGSLTGRCDRFTLPAADAGPGDWLLTNGRVQADVDLERLLAFIRPLYTLPPKARLAGRAVVGLTCEAAAGTVKAAYNGAIQNLALTSPAWDIRESDARMEGRAEWNAADRILRIDDLTGRADFGTLGITRAAFGPAGVNGDLQARLDLAPLSRWRRPTESAPALLHAGTITIRAQAASSATGSDLTLEALGDSLVFDTAAETPWHEPAPRLNVAAHLTAARDVVGISRLTFSHSLASLQGAGTLTNGQSVTLSGDLTVDFDAVGDLLQSRGYRQPALSGRAARPFRFHAPLGAGLAGVLAYGEGELALHLARLNGFGIDTRPADLRASLAKGVVTINYAPPLRQGTMQSRILLEATTTPLVLQLPESAVAFKDVPLTDELLQTLGYINPLFANCTALRGRATLSVGNGRLPLDGTFSSATDFDAIIEINDAELMPGGVLEQILAHTGASGRTLEIEHQRFVAKCRDGRIEIEPHRATLRGNPVTFSGNVGLDQSIRFLVAVPLTGDLVGDKAAKYLTSVTLTVPVEGSIRKPRIDSGALAQQTRKLATEAAQRAMAEQAVDLLEKLRKRVN